MNLIDYICSEDFRLRVRRAFKAYLFCAVVTILICLAVTLFSSCGTSGHLLSENVTNVYINSSISNETSTVQLISDDYSIESIESLDDGTRIIVTLVRKSL